MTFYFKDEKFGSQESAQVLRDHSTLSISKLYFSLQWAEEEGIFEIDNNFSEAFPISEGNICT